MALGLGAEITRRVFLARYQKSALAKARFEKGCCEKIFQKHNQRKLLRFFVPRTEYDVYAAEIFREISHFGTYVNHSVTVV